MLVDIINEQSKVHYVELCIINDTFNVDLINTIDSKVRVYYLNRKPGSRNPISIFKFNYYILKLNPEVVHFHNQNAINLLKFKNKLKTYLTVHDTNIPVLNFKKYDKLFAISNVVKNDILARSNTFSKVIYNGISFKKIKKNTSFKPFTTFKIVQISRLAHTKKGQEVLIKAIEILVNRFNIKNLHIDFIGTGESLAFLKELVNSLGIVKHVDFIGDKSRSFIYKELKNYQLLVQPSYYEGFGLTVVEAMAAKIPLLVSNIEGPMEIIDNGNYGYYFNAGNEEDCAIKIIKIINEFSESKNTEKLNNAYNYAFSNFNIKTTAQNYLDNYLSNNAEFN